MTRDACGDDYFDGAVVVTDGSTGADAAATCSPTRTVSPADRVSAQSVPLQVIVSASMPHDIPQAFTTRAADGLGHEIVHSSVSADEATANSAT